MAERRKKITLADGKVVDGIVVDVVESVERFSELKLSDGAIIKTKLTAVEAVRNDEARDNEGNPVYHLKSQLVMVVSDSPNQLKNRETKRR